MDLQIYDNMMSNPPIIDEKYLISVLHLSKTQLISDIEICSVIESNTALTIRFRILIKEECNDDIIKQFFIKTIKYNPKIPAYHNLSLEEVEFYKFIQNVTNVDLPIAHCFDAYISKDRSKYLLLLEDVSNEFNASDKVNLASENIWFSSACSLAKFHAVFWNADIIGTNDLPIDSKEKISYYIKSTYESYEKYIKYVGNRFDAETIELYEHALKIEIKLQTERYDRLVARDNVTLVHGDSHIHNFMFPHSINKLPIIIDFQFWGTGISVGDVAHLTRVSFPETGGEKLHQSIIKKYYETLLTMNVCGYSWKNCWNDYRMQVASMLLIPVWQFSSFNLEYNEWINDIPSLILNYKLLHCEQLEI